MDKREVALPNGDTVFVRLPGMQEQEDAEWEYSRIFNKAIKNGVVPREVMRDQLRSQGIWTDDDDAKSQQLEESLAYAVAELHRAAEEDDGTPKSKNEYLRLKQRVADYREEYMIHNNKLSSFMNHCAESKADEKRLLYLTYACTEREDGTPYWRSYDEFQQTKSPGVINTAFANFMLFLHGLSANFVDSLPENSIVPKSERAPDEEEEVVAVASKP